MLSETTIDKFNEMHLSKMGELFREFLGSAEFADLSFEEMVGIMVDREWSSRRSSRLSRLCKGAGYVISDACVENINYAAQRKLNKAMIARLSACTFIQDANNIIIQGATGTGKTYLSCALGVSANRNFYPAKYFRLPDLLSDLENARINGTYPKVIREVQRVKLLILDEWMLYPLTKTEARDILEIVDARYKRHSTIFCSQFEVGGWYEKIGDATLADAICDRIVNNAYRVVLEGESMRKILGGVE